MERRRSIATAAVAASSTPARAQRGNLRVLRFVPQDDLTALAPV